MTIGTIYYLMAGLLAAWWLWRQWRAWNSPHPAFLPLQISDNDAEMVAARCQAQETLSEMRQLHAQPNKGVRLKVPFTTSSGVREFLWAEVQELRDDEAQVLYMTPPVTHSGRLERVHVHPLKDVVDWQVELPDGMYRGGFTMRVMLARYRETHGELPSELAAEQRRYESPEA